MAYINTVKKLPYIYQDITAKNANSLLVVTAAVHGNELVGLKAIDALSDIASKIPLKGRIVVIHGNPEATVQEVRYVDQDFNRAFTATNLISEPTNHELVSAQHLSQLMLNLLDEQASNVTKHLLDIHSMSSTGTPFMSFVADKPPQLIIEQTPIPVIEGIIDSLEGCLAKWFAPYFNSSHIVECGQHQEQSTFDFGFHTLIYHLYLFDMLEDCKQVQQAFDYLSSHTHPYSYLKTNICYRQAVNKDQIFEMQPGFVNLQQVNAGQLLAKISGKKVLAPFDGRVILPCYQRQCEEGYFISQDR
ncbi:succinylglutamate desuccinylase/aspartoacylase domain-containing protein [Shewanella woodyi]|uniref:succinylglutamate desuccinylase/aspartoacylase domain-containing protein n=1 Tax=Shewanella woodyi TaxID=60961 RepID=UPI0007EA40BD|nr:succinylglutamate desuccinylase/aspartoacylase family protein [Shewanella woodyi]